MEVQASNALYKDLIVKQVATPVRYLLYCRKSTESDELQALSIDSQEKEMKELAERQGLNVVEVRRESHSAKESGQRPVFQSVIQDIRVGKFNGLIAWDPSRISRNAGDLGMIVDLMDQGMIIDIHTHGQRFTNSPNEKFLLMILCSQAKLENDHKGENVKRGLRAKCEQGYRPGVSPLGYINDKYADKGSKRVLLDSERGPIIKEMFEKVAYENCSGRDLMTWLNKVKNFTTRSGKRIALSAIFTILKDTYYYGEFEYPIGSGKWYKGAYDSIITKELYLKARANVQSPPRRHPGTNEFDFTRLFYCGKCGSGISAEEKFKHCKNGKTHRYVYYHCNHSSDRYCTEKAIREEDLIEQLLFIVDKIDIDEIEIKEKINIEINKYRQFSYIILGKETEFDNKQIEADTKNYIKHVLKNGTKDQKREILECLKSEIVLIDKIILLKN
jgi:DNA invertase Pin-like site-specific DNA recombinase